MRVAGRAAPQGDPWWRASPAGSQGGRGSASRTPAPARRGRGGPRPVQKPLGGIRARGASAGLGDEDGPANGRSLVKSGCAGCGEEVRVRLDIRAAEGPNWSQRAPSPTPTQASLFGNVPSVDLWTLMRST